MPLVCIPAGVGVESERARVPRPLNATLTAHVANDSENSVGPGQAICRISTTLLRSLFRRRPGKNWKSSNWAKLAVVFVTLFGSKLSVAQERGPGTPQLTAEQSSAVEKQNAEEAKAWNAIPAPLNPRDLQGVWWVRGYDSTFRPITAPPLSPDESAKLLPLTPLEAKNRQHRLTMAKAGTPLVDASTDCYPHGVPRIMASPYPIQVNYQPGLIIMLHEVAHNVRYIHMDQKEPPPDTPLTYMGYSRGHWRGDTLVINTDHFNDKTQIDEESLSHGLRLQVHEELTKITNKYGGTELRNLITISDPDHYTHPWTAERYYAWRGDVRLTEYSCEENNRNKSVNGVTVAK